MTLYLLNFNNYHNRIIKGFSNINNYSAYILESFENINFNPNDGISTEHIVNYYGASPNYAIVCDDSNNILHRWFIIESQRTRLQQYRMTLYRDVIYDYLNDITQAPVFIEKALARIGDTAIYNSENMSYNQIKQTERLLKDVSQSAWIVGYLDSEAEGTEIVIPQNQSTVSGSYTSLDEYDYYKYKDGVIPGEYAASVFRMNFYNTGLSGGKYVLAYNQSGDLVKPALDVLPGAAGAGFYMQTGTSNKGYAVPYSLLSSTGLDEMSKVSFDLKAPIKAQNWTIYSPSSASFGNEFTSLSPETLLNEDGKIIQADNKYYKIHARIGEVVSRKSTIVSSSGLGLTMSSVVAQSPNVDLNTKIEPLFEYEITGATISFDFEETFIDSYTINIPSASARYHLTDAPYDMFAIPYGDIKVKNLNNAIHETNANLGIRLAAELQKHYQNFLYDIQLLPYCPLEDRVFTGGATVTLNESRLLEDQLEYVRADNSLNNPSCMVWLTTSSFIKNIQLILPVSTDNIEFKVQNECDFYRLSSPNYASSFEFSATKNNGVIAFIASCQYKPYSPYIRVAPVFNGLYGRIFDDARGLICNGDFSLPQISDAWIQYQQQNKNFQEIFNRQIENMEVNNNVARIKETVGMYSGAVSAGVSGVMTGQLVGGGVGAAVGAVSATGVSLAAGIADRRLNEQLRSEAMDYTVDQFGYQLGNIRALPNTITKVSSFNPNNKIFPVLEYYTCTEVEKEALRNKIKYNGMTIMRIGKINEFIAEQPSYIKGKLIRLEIAEDFHLVNTIANELNKGVFI